MPHIKQHDPPIFGVNPNVNPFSDIFFFFINTKNPPFFHRIKKMPYDFKSSIEARPEPCAEDRNFASPTGFRVLIEGDNFSDVEYAIQTISLPDISCSPVSIPSSSSEFFVPGDKIEYGDLGFTFLVDETFINYRQIHDWILSNALIDNPNLKKTREIVLMPFTSHNNVSVSFRFADAFPISLSSLEYNTTLTDINYLTASVDFKYSYFKFD